MAHAPTRLRPGPWFLTGPLVGLLVLSAMGIPFAIDPLYAGVQTLRLVTLLALYLLLVNAPLKRRGVAWPLAVGMAVQSMVAVPQFVLGHTLGLARLGEVTIDAAWPGASVVMVGEARYLRAYGLVQHPNLLAGCLMAMLLVVTGYYLMQRGWKRLPLLVALALGFVTLLLTFSRAAWLGTFAGGLAALLLLFWAWRRGRWAPNRSNVALLAFILVAVGAAFVALNWPLLQPRLGLTTQGTEIRSVEARAMQVPAAWALIQMRPLLGVGLGNYPTALYRLARDLVAAYPIYQPVYNVPLLVTAELGVLGGLLWVALISLPWLNLWLPAPPGPDHPLVGRAERRAAGPDGGQLFRLLRVDLSPGAAGLWLVLGLWAREWARRPDHG